MGCISVFGELRGVPSDSSIRSSRRHPVSWRVVRYASRDGERALTAGDELILTASGGSGYETRGESPIIRSPEGESDTLSIDEHAWSGYPPAAIFLTSTVSTSRDCCRFGPRNVASEVVGRVPLGKSAPRTGRSGPNPV